MTTHETGDDASSSEGTVTVTEADSGTYTQQITAGHGGPHRHIVIVTAAAARGHH